MYIKQTIGQSGSIYQSTLLSQYGVPHAFSTRNAPQGGPWDLTHVRHTEHLKQPGHAPLSPHYAALLHAINCPDYPLVHVSQVHGREVLLVDKHDLQTPTPPREADGLMTAQPGVALTIRMADCVPILLAAVVDGRPAAVAAVHAGWRGLVAGVIAQAVRGMHQLIRKQAIDSTILTAAIGPCISATHFEVGPEVAQAFIDANLAAAVIENQGRKPHIDLPLAARLELLAGGLSDDMIEPGTLCTYQQPSDFFSHRRETGRTGRLAAMIALPRSQSHSTTPP